LPSPFLKRQPSWLLLPKSQLNPFQILALDKNVQGFAAPYHLVYNFKIQYPKDSFQFALAKNVYKYDKPYEEIVSSVKRAFMQNQKLRYRLKRLLNIYLLRKFQTVNTEDIVTLEPIEKLVKIYDWSSKKSYCFEAKSLLNDSVNRLLYHSELFLDPKQPRNLLTNEPLSYNQLISIHQQLLSHGVTNWVWECFATSGFNMANLVWNYEIPIQLHILKNLIKAGTEHTIHDLIVDFILSEYEHHDFSVAPPESVLYFLLKTSWNTALIHEWVTECNLSWEYRIRKVADLNKRVAQIHGRTLALVEKTPQLIQLYKTIRSK
jgi:hypothetical protein